MKKRHFTKISLICLVCLLTTIIGCINIGYWARAKYERTDQLNAHLASGSTLIAKTDVGSITVTGLDVNACNVTATICVKAPTDEEAQELADQIKIELNQDEKTLTVKTEKPRLKRHRSISISFDITVPKQTALELGSNVGEIQVTNITDKIKAETNVGKITCEEIAGNIDVKADVGTIKIVYSKTAPAACSATISTDVGSINLTAPLNCSAVVHAETDVGSITTGQPLTITGKIGRNLNGTLGAGEGKLYLKTDVGSIKLK